MTVRKSGAHAQREWRTDHWHNKNRATSRYFPIQSHLRTLALLDEAHRLHGVAIATPDRPRAGTPAPSDSATRHRRAHKLHAPGARAAAPHARAYAYTPVHIHHRARESLPARTTPVLALTQRACHTFHSAASAGDVFHSALNMKEGPLRRQHQLGHPRRFRRYRNLQLPRAESHRNIIFLSHHPASREAHFWEVVPSDRAHRETPISGLGPGLVMPR